MTRGRILSILHSCRQILGDPTLRSWLVDRVAHGRSLSRSEKRIHPPCLDGLTIDPAGRVNLDAGDLVATEPAGDISISLPNGSASVGADNLNGLFDIQFDDIESSLALHRFSWIEQVSSFQSGPGWIAAIWRTWTDRHGEPDESWAWHPYTAAERLINILKFSERFGVPSPRDVTLSALQKHGRAIFDRLEYFGPGRTGNHLANNGRGLFLAGLALGRPDWAEIGGRILIGHAGAVFLPSGVLCQGSSHYHLLATRWYLEAASVARRHARPEAEVLTLIAERAQRIVPSLLLPGGFPLIGDISPDDAPWNVLAGVAKADASVDNDQLLADGWCRYDSNGWHMLAYLAPDGLSPMPGHGHRDVGSFEVHHGTEPIFIDPGRRSYRPIDDGQCAAAMHNTIVIDGHEPYPINKPYYDGAFRRNIAGPSPRFARTPAGLVLTAEGFGRFPHLGRWERSWHFADSMMIKDRINGTGGHIISRFFHTSLPVALDGADLTLGEYILRTDNPSDRIFVRPSRRWTAYGVGKDAVSIEIISDARLPWAGSVEIARR